MINLPNVISLLRLASVPVTVWAMINHFYVLAFWLFTIAGATDAIDGYLARRLRATSRLGAFLDPLADKSLLVAVYAVLGHQGYISAWLLILIVFRELVIVGGAILYQIMTLRLTIQPLFVSKLNTMVQILLAAIILAELAMAGRMGPIREALIGIVAATTVISGLAYVAIWGLKLTREEGLK